MKTTCLVNNFNYRNFVIEAVDSALDQTIPFDEVIVVDDGSTDGSAQLLEKKYAGHERVRIVVKANEGQLSCFNEGFRIATGDLVFFLDADDQYEATYLQHALEIYEHESACDCMLAAWSIFGDNKRETPVPARDQDLGYSVILTMCGKAWIGAPTSCLSMRRPVLQKILPIPYLEDWKVRADDCLVFGSSLAGARKYQLGLPLVRYRSHGNHYYSGRPYDKFADFRRKLAIHRLFELFRSRLGYDAVHLPDFLHREFRTIAAPSAGRLLHYLQILFGTKVGFFRKLGLAGSLLSYYVQARIRPGAPRTAATPHAQPVNPKRAEERRIREPASSNFGTRNTYET